MAARPPFFVQGKGWGAGVNLELDSGERSLLRFQHARRIFGKLPSDLCLKVEASTASERLTGALYAVRIRGSFTRYAHA